jgi:class 3 adenylate cyclase/predicted ATPase
MHFFDMLTQVIGLLVLERRVSYRTLKLQFDLDDTTLAALKEAIIDVHQLAVDQEGTMLVWNGGPPSAVSAASPVSQAATAVSPPIPPTLPSSSATPEALPDESATTPAALHTPDAERRQVTVLFCDLVDSTQLAQQLDPEDYRSVVRAYQEAVVTAIQPFDGYVAQYLGDGLLLYFGWPQAHEDAPVRAVHASLAIVEAMVPLNARVQPRYRVRVAVRLGLHTGLAVIGQMGSGARQEQLAMGDTPNIAARLQGLAAPDTVVLSAATARLVQGVFALQEMGIQTLQGVTEPLPVWRVVGPSTMLHEDEDAGLDRVPPFLVGRDEEVGLLLRRWQQSQEGVGQVVLVSGEAGIGKSALVGALRQHVRPAGALCLTLRCSPYHTHSALYPIITHVQHVLHFVPEDTAEGRLTRLERLLGTYRQPLTEVVPLLAALLAVSLPEGRYAPLTLSPQQQRQQTLDALVAWLLEEAERQPVLAVYEDLHWADPSTLELLGMLVEQAPTASMLHVLTFRPDFIPPWPMRSHMMPLTLSRLERPQVEALLTHLAGGKALPAEVVRYIVSKTDGVPLFVEELTRMLLESALLREDTDHYTLLRPLSSLTIPATLQDALMARLERVPGVKEVAQLGAVLGREFPYAWLRPISPLDEEALQDRLAQLVAAELLYQRGRPPRARYIFKHALIQEAAYQSLLKCTRQQVHQKVAELLEARFPETVEGQPELLAHHYTDAGLIEQAIPYWQRAGQQALQRSANLEAVQHLTTGLRLLATLPEAPARAQQDLDLLTALGPALIAAKGRGAPEVEQIYVRARALCVQLGETPLLFPVLRGLWQFYLARGALLKARQLGEHLDRLVQGETALMPRLEAHDALGTILFYSGEYGAARVYLEQGIALTDPSVQQALVLHRGEAPGVTFLAQTALTLWCLGSPTQAIQRSQEALALARTLAHPYSLARAQLWAAYVHHRRREAPAVQEQAEALLALATTHAFPLYVGLGTCFRGWALAVQGWGETGMAQMHQGLAAVIATGQELAQPRCLVLLAEAAGHTGQVEEGLHLLDGALAALETSGQGDLLAEAYRLQGTLLLRQAAPDVAQAEACFQQALTVARRQQAKSWELRVAMSLSRLWQQQGKRDAAQELLTPIYGWFTEGFDTADLQEAKALLEELA